MACRQVDSLAKTGFVKTDYFELCVSGLLNRSPDSAEALITPSQPSHEMWLEIASQLEFTEQLLNDFRGPNNSDILRYSLGVLHLQKKLSQNKQMLNAMSVRLEKVDTQVEHFGLSHENVLASIAQLYTETLSTMPFRIQVNGEYGYLQQPRVVNQVRTLLLCAVRYATLWRQLGGKKWHLLLYKKKMARAAHELVLEYKKRAENT